MGLKMNSVKVGSIRVTSTVLPTYRYFRVNVTSYAGLEVRLSSVQINVGANDYPWQLGLGGMTSDNEPSPLVASASSVFADNINFLPYKAFVIPGTNTTERWIAGTSQATPVWIQIDLGAGNEIAPTSLVLCADEDGDAGEYIATFTFLGSNTGSFSGEQDTLYTSGTLTQGNWIEYGCNLFTF